MLGLQQLQHLAVRRPAGLAAAGRSAGRAARTAPDRAACGESITNSPPADLPDPVPQLVGALAHPGGDLAEPVDVDAHAGPRAPCRPGRATSGSSIVPPQGLEALGAQRVELAGRQVEDQRRGPARARAPSPSGPSTPSPASLGDLVERVAPPAGLQQVGGDHGVVRRGAARRRPARAAATWCRARPPRTPRSAAARPGAASSSQGPVSTVGAVAAATAHRPSATARPTRSAPARRRPRPVGVGLLGADARVSTAGGGRGGGASRASSGRRRVQALELEAVEAARRWPPPAPAPRSSGGTSSRSSSTGDVARR